MRTEDDDRPKKKIAHEIGADLSMISAAELRERIALLLEEIARLKADIARKEAWRTSRARRHRRRPRTPSSSAEIHYNFTL